MAQPEIRGGLPQRLCDSGRSQSRHGCLARLLQRGAPAPEPRLSHAAANLPGRPMDMWTIGFADWVRFPRFPSKLGRRGNACLRPHTPKPTKDLILMKWTVDTSNQPSRSLRSEPTSKSLGLHLKTRLRLSHVRGPPHNPRPAPPLPSRYSPTMTIALHGCWNRNTASLYQTGRS